MCCEYLFDSVRPTAVLPCGHTIHSACLKELQRNRTSTCPICLKSYGNMDKVCTKGLCLRRCLQHTKRLWCSSNARVESTASTLYELHDRISHNICRCGSGSMRRSPRRRCRKSTAIGRCVITAPCYPKCQSGGIRGMWAVHDRTALLLLTVAGMLLQVELLCNDCQHSSRVRFHIVGQKCPAPGCGSYNSRRVTIIRIPADAPEDTIPELPPPQQAAAPPADA